MRMTAWEEERLLIFTAAELARRHRAAGLRLNHPEAVALICDAMLEAARAGASYEAVEAAGHAAVRSDAVMDGVRTLLDEVRLEVLVGDGTRLVVLVDPLGASTGAAADTFRPGEIRLALDGPTDATTSREQRTISVRNGSTRAVRVSSHYPFERVNARLEFDRAAVEGFRLDIPAGASVRWAPGETRAVELVRYAGRLGREGSARAAGARAGGSPDAEAGTSTER
jgi:urease subunit gamma/beta